MIACHIHTCLCGHAKGRMEDYVRNAEAAGLTGLLFMDHLTLQDPSMGMSMTEAEVPLYVDAVRDIADRWRGRVDVGVGLEIDFHPSYLDRIHSIVEIFDFDAVAGSVHYVDGANIASRRARTTPARPVDDIAPRYADLLIALLESGYADFICHLDLYKKFGERPAAELGGKTEEVLEALKESGAAVECNTSGWDNPAEEAYPAPVLLARCREMGIDAVLSSDAHKPEQVGRHFRRAVETLKTAGYGRVTGFSGRRRFYETLET